ncbi:MAG: CDP-alcohol phosphatidyltransferase family protein [Vicinamibacterales bacterium]
MRDTRRYNVGVAIGSGLVGAAGLGWIAGSPADAGVSYALKAATVFGMLMAAVVSVAGDRHPHARFGPANYVTTARAVLVAVVAGPIGRGATSATLWAAIAIAALAAALDGLDGWLARRSGMASEFGARFDMETDAALILLLSILVWQQDKAGVWVLLCGVMRYGFVAAGWLWPWLAGPLRSTLRGKTVAVGQMLGLGVALAPVVRPPLSDVAAAITLAALVWSFAIDVIWLSHQPRACP